MTITASGSETEPFCALCNGAVGAIKYAYSDMKIVRCANCGLWRACPRLSATQLTAYYEDYYYSTDIQRSGQYEQWRETHKDVWSVNAQLIKREALARGLGSSGNFTLLDVGSGHGFFLEQCAALGIDARGIETSPHAVAYSREKLKLDVRAMPLDELPAEELYDVITLWGVLEHVPQPLETMRQVIQHLRPGGMTWVMTPNTNALERLIRGANYFNFLNKSHLTHFHRATLRTLLERAGFVNVQRYIHWGGGTRNGIGALGQYAARVLCLGTELRFVGHRAISIQH
jgi:2-polyprenyl-3-methyl-5-hydroxy-6-metoxy-1,4-benzoquinol methylase